LSEFRKVILESPEKNIKKRRRRRRRRKKWEKRECLEFYMV
jgi:hypothetical protein